MQESNVVSLFTVKTAVNGVTKTDELYRADEGFKETMRKNAENKKRMQENRLQSNQSVLRSYRIKK